jgi:predicted Zn finger-like uncharacterized protein
MDKLVFTCPACQSSLQIGNPALRGKKVLCPKCSQVFTLPTDAPAEPRGEEVRHDPAPRPPRGDDPYERRPAPPRDDPHERRPAPPRDDYDDEDDYRPRRRRRRRERGSSALLWILLGVGGFVLLGCGGGIVGLVIWINSLSNQTDDRIFEADNGVNVKGKLVAGNRNTREGRFRKIYQVRMKQGRVYTLRLNASDGRMDPTLAVEDANGAELAFNDDAPFENTLNSRIDFLCPRDGVYRLVAGNLRPDEGGDFFLIVEPRR